MRALPRDAWIDALAHCPEQRQKLIEFTEVQTEKIECERDKVMRSLASRRIRRREREAVGKYQDRADLGNQQRQWAMSVSNAVKKCSVSKMLSKEGRKELFKESMLSSVTSIQDQSMFSSIMSAERQAASPNSSVHHAVSAQRVAARMSGLFRSAKSTVASTPQDTMQVVMPSLPGVVPERWECFNGDEVSVPQTQLPCLNPESTSTKPK